MFWWLEEHGIYVVEHGREKVATKRENIRRCMGVYVAICKIQSSKEWIMKVGVGSCAASLYLFDFVLVTCSYFICPLFTYWLFVRNNGVRCMIDFPIQIIANVFCCYQLPSEKYQFRLVKRCNNVIKIFIKHRIAKV